MFDIVREKFPGAFTAVTPRATRHCASDTWSTPDPVAGGEGTSLTVNTCHGVGVAANGRRTPKRARKCPGRRLDRRRYTIDELAAQTGVPSRTIRLLPGQGRARAAGPARADRVLRRVTRQQAAPAFVAATCKIAGSASVRSAICSSEPRAARCPCRSGSESASSSARAVGPTIGRASAPRKSSSSSSGPPMASGALLVADLARPEP